MSYFKHLLVFLRRRESSNYIWNKTSDFDPWENPRKEKANTRLVLKVVRATMDLPRRV